MQIRQIVLYVGSAAGISEIPEVSFTALQAAAAAAAVFPLLPGCLHPPPPEPSPITNT